MNGFGVYVHIPFCPSRCTYCDFTVATNIGEADQARYYKALEAEWNQEALPDGPVLSVYFGGGTPSLAAPGVIQRVLDAVETRRHLVEGAEITLEANPGTVTEASLRGYRSAGVNRLSLGLQAGQDHQLRALNRRHSVDDARQAMRDARRAGFGNISVDVIYGLPGQTLKDWAETLDILRDLDPDHCSLYQLQVEPGTVLAVGVRRGRVQLPPEDSVADMADLALERLTRAGLVRYEISNFARSGQQSVHNGLYWTLASYVGIGAGAHSFHRPRRWWNHRGVRTYLNRALDGDDPMAGQERLDRSVLAGEFMWLGLRQVAGVSRQRFEEWFGMPIETAFPGVLEGLKAQGLVMSDNACVRLTARGLEVGNQVFQRFLASEIS